MAKAANEADDVALVIGATPARDKLAVLRKRGDKLEAALVEKAEEGKPLSGDLVRMTAREEPLLYDVETLYEAPQRSGSGPAKVTSDRYREGWDRLFAKKRSKERSALN